MVRNVSKYLLSVVFIISILVSSTFSADTLYAGLRCSEYGLDPMPEASWIAETSRLMAKRFEKPNRVVIPCVIWISSSWEWDDEWVNDEYLSYFDDNGIKAILQVEPYEEPVMTWIASQLEAYGDHSCIIGFGVDVEWYYPEENDGLGRVVTESDAKKWRAKVKQFNSDYFLMLKHFFPKWLPKTDQKDILFLDDSQQFPSFERFLNETDEKTKWNVGYRVWASTFDNQSGYSGMQYGYDDGSNDQPSDKDWWNKLDDPQKEIGDSCLAVGANTSFLFWVDFTCQDDDISWEYVTNTKEEIEINYSQALITIQNRTISVKRSSLQKAVPATIKLFNLEGTLLMSKKYSNSSRDINLKVSNSISKGLYLVKVVSNNQTFYNRISLY